MNNSRFTVLPGTVYFVGAGPGAPDLITVRGQEVIAQADLILYADSLVEESVAQLGRKAEAQIETSSGLHLEQILGLMVEAAQAGQVVARIHSGDPALYGAIHEQMAYLEDYDIPYKIIPGVTAAFAIAADFKTELTVPDVVQTIILTRTAGRTTMPQGEDLQTLAAPGASLAIYLSVSRIRHVVDDLLASGGYQPDSPVIVSHKATWPDESHVVGTLSDIVEKVKEAGYTKHALVLVSPALDPLLKGENRRTSSHLYDKSYTHRFRKAKNFQRGKEKQEAQGQVKGVIAGEKHLGSQQSKQGCVVISITKQGSQLAQTLAQTLQANLSTPAKFAAPLSNGQTAHNTYSDSALAEIRRRWPGTAELVLVMPTGVAIRAIAPLLAHKSSDPAVICLDEAGQSVIPLLGGHQAGANALAQRIAVLTSGHAAITTASDVQGKPALDTPPQTNRQVWHIDPASAVTYTSACLVNGDSLGVFVDPALPYVRHQTEAWLAAEAGLSDGESITYLDTLDDLDLDAYAAGLIITHQSLSDHHQHLLQKSILYRPAVLVAGMGCKRDVAMAELQEALQTTLSDNQLAIESVSAIATVDLKANEVGLQTLAEQLKLSLIIVNSETLVALALDQFSPSAAQDKFGLPGVAEPCATVVAGKNSTLLVNKQSFAQCTVAIAMGD